MNRLISVFVVLLVLTSLMVSVAAAQERSRPKNQLQILSETLKNRFGGQITRILSPENAWDGRNDKGVLAKAGVYLYVVKVQGQVVCKGTITLAK